MAAPHERGIGSRFVIVVTTWFPPFQFVAVGTEQLHTVLANTLNDRKEEGRPTCSPFLSMSATVVIYVVNLESTTVIVSAARAFATKTSNGSLSESAVSRQNPYPLGFPKRRILDAFLVVLSATLAVRLRVCIATFTQSRFIFFPVFFKVSREIHLDLFSVFRSIPRFASLTFLQVSHYPMMTLPVMVSLIQPGTSSR